MIKHRDQQGEPNGSITRAEFLKGAALVGVGIGTAGVLAGCAPNDSGSGTTMTWDKEVDVLIVGSGSVAFAGLAAKDAGAESVLIVEKLDVWGGTTGLSGAGMGIPVNYVAREMGIEDTREKAIAYITAASEGRSNDELIAAYVDNGNAFLEWTRDTFGWKWGFPGGETFQDYYEPIEGFLPFGRGAVTPINEDTRGGGGDLHPWQKLKAQLEENGVEILMETAVKRLVKDDSGAVVGVVAADKDGAEIKIGAKGVILGTGGFDHNAQMRAAYLTLPIMVTNASPGCTGDGHRMGMEIGADLGTMASCWGLPCFLPEPVNAPAEIKYDFTSNDWASYRGHPGAVVVNKHGRRFGNEASVYATFNRSFEQWDSGLKEYRNLPAYFICDSTYTAYYTFPGAKAPGEIPEWVASANTLEELAGKLGIDQVGLIDEIAAFNANAADGLDPVWHRGEYAIDKTTSNLYKNYGGPDRTDLKNPALAPVAVGPFYGAMYGPGTCGTNGGLRINKNAQVLHVSGEPIPGLYAAGNCAMSVSGGAYAHGGMTVGSGAVMSWLAVRHVMGKTE